MTKNIEQRGGETLFLVMGIAVYLTVAVICAAAFLPATAGVVVALGAVVLVAVVLARFIASFIGPSGH
jgi:hypothetical protein